MKNFFYSFLLLAVAIMTATTLVSCGSDDDEKESAAEETHVFFKYWVADDVFEIADYTVTGLSSYTFSASEALDGIPGKMGTPIHLQGKAADEANFSITFTLKSNWREIIANKTTINIASAKLYEKTKNSNGGSGNLNVQSGKGIHVEKLDEESLTRLIKAVGFSSK